MRRRIPVSSVRRFNACIRYSGSGYCVLQNISCLYVRKPWCFLFCLCEKTKMYFRSSFIISPKVHILLPICILTFPNTSIRILKKKPCRSSCTKINEPPYTDGTWLTPTTPSALLLSAPASVMCVLECCAYYELVYFVYVFLSVIFFFSKACEVHVSRKFKVRRYNI